MKNSQQSKTRRKLPQLKKNIHDKPRAHIILMENVSTFYLISGKQGCLLSPLLFNIVQGSLSQCSKPRKEKTYRLKRSKTVLYK